VLAIARSAIGVGAVVEHTPCGDIPENGRATARLEVAGAQMRDSVGAVFVPYGISLVSGPETRNWAISEKSVAAQIDAAHRYWHANTVRIQVSQGQLFAQPSHGHSYNVRFAASVDRLVCRALRLGLIPVVNDNTIFTGKKHGPTELTRRFWSFMSRRYGNRLPVIFDLYNEPQLIRSARTGRYLSAEKAWRLWRDGGTVGGERYLGMQALVDEIRRKQRARNVIWAEQPYYSQLDRTRLDLLAQHLLRGTDIVYAFHKLPMQSDAASLRHVSELAARGIPLASSEWTQFAATDRPWMCQPDSYRTTPPYLALMHELSIGLLGWSLQPGSLVKGVAGRDTVHDGNDWRYTTDPRRLREPSEMKPSYGCKRSARGQGAGALLQDYFKRYSVPAPEALFPVFR
jgi:hypothetical protein